MLVSRKDSLSGCSRSGLIPGSFTLSRYSSSGQTDAGVNSDILLVPKAQPAWHNGLWTCHEKLVDGTALYQPSTAGVEIRVVPIGLREHHHDVKVAWPGGPVAEGCVVATTGGRPVGTSGAFRPTSSRTQATEEAVTVSCLRETKWQILRYTVTYQIT
ncbi:unnamed protein product [Protopolystoma xenopodis]|uniref:Uncharacterized protein n=1 Tax=Protopolystoma xenopodis TaxID=117903 RepID=A0A3S5CMW7_9PLAT|nr:unnamed protein product [Protopolystoma xenopodis]